MKEEVLVGTFICEMLRHESCSAVQRGLAPSFHLCRSSSLGLCVAGAEVPARFLAARPLSPGSLSWQRPRHLPGFALEAPVIPCGELGGPSLQEPPFTLHPG
jgi:hypothetical protein